jgi:hypothetical protein
MTSGTAANRLVEVAVEIADALLWEVFSTSPEHRAENGVYQAVLRMLLGRAPTTVGLVDDPGNRSRYIGLGEIGELFRTEGPPWSRVAYPLLVRTTTPVWEGLERHEGTLRVRPGARREHDLLDQRQWLRADGVPKALSTRDVHKFYVGMCGLHMHRADFPGQDWIPVASNWEDSVYVALAGDVPEVETVWRDGDHRIYWRSPANVPIDGSIWSMWHSYDAHGAKVGATLWVFTHRRTDQWELTVVPHVRWASTLPRTEGGLLVPARDFGAVLHGAVSLARRREPELAWQ